MKKAEQKFTAVCNHPACRWHAANDNRETLMAIAKTHRDEACHTVRVFAPTSYVRANVESEAGRAAAFRLIKDTPAGRQLLVTLKY